MTAGCAVGDVVAVNSGVGVVGGGVAAAVVVGNRFVVGGDGSSGGDCCCLCKCEYVLIFVCRRSLTLLTTV